MYQLEIPLPNNPLRALNSYIIKGKQRNLIIDTGFNREECLDAMLSGLASLEVDLSVTDLFITHLHADHSGLISHLATGTSQVFCSRIDSEKSTTATTGTIGCSMPAAMDFRRSMRRSQNIHFSGPAPTSG